MRQSINSSLYSFLRDDSGATALEYGLILAGVGLVVSAGITKLGNKTNGLFKAVADKVVAP